VTKLTTPEVNTTQVTLAWTEPSSNSQVNKYVAHYSGGGSSSTKDAGKNSSVIITNLTPGQEYEFTVVTHEVGSRSDNQMITSGTHKDRTCNYLFHVCICNLFSFIYKSSNL